MCYSVFSRHSYLVFSSLQRDYFCASGTPWTEEEHRMFLMGLQKLGKGDWRGISRNFVVSRTPTQVASHAQKYFIRQTNSSRRKRRSSLFDMVAEMVCFLFSCNNTLMLEMVYIHYALSF